MATVNNPLLSLSASGKFADRLVFKQARRAARVSKFSTPTGDPSFEQVIHRGNMTNVSGNFKTLFSGAEIIASWFRYAVLKDKRLTAANFFIRSVLSLAFNGEAPAFVVAACGVGRVAVFSFTNPFSGIVSNETGFFSVRSGSAASALAMINAKTIDAGKIIGPVAPVGGTWFYQLFKDGIPRSGIISLTQTQAATYDQVEAAGVTWYQLLNAGITWSDLV